MWKSGDNEIVNDVEDNFCLKSDQVRRMGQIIYQVQ